jgi:hypothetical protein
VSCNRSPTSIYRSVDAGDTSYIQYSSMCTQDMPAAAGVVYVSDETGRSNAWLQAVRVCQCVYVSVSFNLPKIWIFTGS